MPSSDNGTHQRTENPRPVGTVLIWAVMTLEKLTDALDLLRSRRAMKVAIKH